MGWHHVNENVTHHLQSISFTKRERNYGSVGWNERMIIDHGQLTFATLLKFYSVSSNYPLSYLSANISKMR